MSTTKYNGTFTVVNCTGNTITGVTVTHTAGTFTNTAPSNAMAPASSINQALNTETGSSDSWSVTFTMNGQTYSRSGKGCDFEQEDEAQTCIVSLYQADWSIVMPVSSSCEHNYYSTPSALAGAASREQQKPAKAA